MALRQGDFNYGGQAVIEGVMMRGSKALSVAVRNPQAEIVIHTEPLNQRIYGSRTMRIPFVRGLTLLWDALGLGVKALLFSADVAMEEPVDPNNPDGEQKANPFEGPAQWGTVALSLTMSVALFFLLPAFIAGYLETAVSLSSILANVVEGVIRLVLVVGYIVAIGFMPDIRRLYGYHGAEHKTINAFEDGAELTPEVVARYPLEHPRCGTAFLLSVVLISILIFSLFPSMSLPLRLLSRLLLLPVVAGIAYEFIRFTARHQSNPLIRLIIVPNLALQRLTTREPDTGMLEVAIAAFEQVMAFEREQVAAEPALTTVPTAASS